jgi:tetratricopeptide (TPR) repeat protein
MRLSRFGLLFLIAASVFAGSSCGYYNRIMSRKDLVDGSVAYRERKFAEAEDLFRKAAGRDPDGSTLEGKTAQVFLARTLHSRYIGNRQDTSLAEAAITEYQKALKANPNDQSSYKAVASLYENLLKTDEWQRWVTERSSNTSIEPQFRAEALTALAAKQNTCANDISDTEATKKTVKGADGKEIYQFVKPADQAQLDKMRECVAKGQELIGQAMSAEPDAVKNAKSANLKSLTDEQLKQLNDQVKIFESARSYRASITIQASRLAEMEGRTADKDRLKAEADNYRKEYTELGEASRAIQSEIEARVAAAEAAANANANANAAK